MTRGAAALVALAALSGCAAPHVARPPASAAIAPSRHIRLVGATPGMLRADLGDPSLRRIDGPAEVWLYQSDLCRLDVIFYRGSAGQPVVSLARPLPSTVPGTTCVASLEQKRAS